MKSQGSYLENKRMPKEGEIVHCLLTFPTRIIKGKVTRVSNIDNRGLGNTYMDIVYSNFCYHVSIDQIYDHKPHQIKIQDGFGSVVVWK